MYDFVLHFRSFAHCIKTSLHTSVSQVQHMSASDDAEASMISKLKQACGFEYTSKLQRMFQDIGVSKDLNENFRRHLSNTGEPLDIDFSIQVKDTPQ